MLQGLIRHIEQISNAQRAYIFALKTSSPKSLAFMHLRQSFSRSRSPARPRGPESRQGEGGRGGEPAEGNEAQVRSGARRAEGGGNADLFVKWNESYIDPTSERRQMLELRIMRQPKEILHYIAARPRSNRRPGTAWSHRAAASCFAHRRNLPRLYGYFNRCRSGPGGYLCGHHF